MSASAPPPESSKRESPKPESPPPSSTTSGPPPSLEGKLWTGLLGIAGAVVGLAALVYLIGAATLWLGLKSRGYSPDVGIEHQPRSQLIGLGLRGILIVAGIAALTLLAGFVGSLLHVRKRITFEVASVASAAALFVASWFSWRWIALAIAASTLVFLIAIHRLRPRSRRHMYWLILPPAAVLTALAWQYGGPIYVNGVAVTPESAMPFEDIFRGHETCTLSGGRSARSSHAWLKGRPVWIAEENACGYKPARVRKEIVDYLHDICLAPYFGESAKFVYVGAIRKVWEDRAGSCRWKEGPIVELQRDKVQLRFVNVKVFLNPNRTRPIDAGWNAVTTFFEKLG